jgi:hypothetical protein
VTPADDPAGVAVSTASHLYLIRLALMVPLAVTVLLKLASATSHTVTVAVPL